VRRSLWRTKVEQFLNKLVRCKTRRLSGSNGNVDRHGVKFIDPLIRSAVQPVYLERFICELSGQDGLKKKTKKTTAASGIARYAKLWSSKVVNYQYFVFRDMNSLLKILFFRFSFSICFLTFELSRNCSAFFYLKLCQREKNTHTYIYREISQLNFYMLSRSNIISTPRAPFFYSNCMI